MTQQQLDAIDRINQIILDERLEEVVVLVDITQTEKSTIGTPIPPKKPQ